MFTGIVQEQGIVKAIENNREGILLRISCSELLEKMNIDDSVAINGVCQTVIALSDGFFTVQAVGETLRKTNLGQLKSGERVNLELAATVTTFLGGHLVQGHINGSGKLLQIQKIGKNLELYIKLTDELMPYVVKEGSITLDGVSLTVANIDRTKQTIKISLIPHSGDRTTLASKQVGYNFNIEVDIIAKYVENLLFYNKSSKSSEEKVSSLSAEWLHSKGF